ncbi:YybH family protein [Streptomyces qinzhouensis]|uniref:SgcJ/EcaC family oxidoreductase n=1 Tax=Streptomyces qinzhouensis TaxID=2599401 RepID=A0A5B8J237_9ACTN|nr:SgcJ/EcaC family oxidoreductase [Streptomyces qinzhouensis]QDY75216.1 SgcJ/EcaC family oxidoreductase [Streptomyces qinzhouensis]QDY80582.1 SgcJ/EcaC family oxidoreductase [Streptomyces qinzhouensis]
MPAQRPQDIPGLIAEAFNTNDPQAMLDLYEPDGILVTPPDGAQEKGLAAVAEALKPMFAAITTAAITMTSALRSGDLAMTHADWHLKGTDETGKPIDLKGKGTVVSRRQPDGTWRIVFDDPVGA